MEEAGQFFDEKVDGAARFSHGGLGTGGLGSDLFHKERPIIFSPVVQSHMRGFSFSNYLILVSELCPFCQGVALR